MPNYLDGLVLPDRHITSNPKAIRKVFRATVALAKNFELIGGKLLTGDSTKLAYNIQATVDAKHNIPIDFKVTNQQDKALQNSCLQVLQFL